MATLPNLSQLPLSTAHEGEFQELTADEIALLSPAGLKEYEKHREKHRAKHETPKEKEINIYRG